MKLEEMEVAQIQEALKAGTPEEIKAYLDEQGIELPEKAPFELPEGIEKLGKKLWQTVKFPPRFVCAAEEHDYQPTGKCEMERTIATGIGSSFRREYRCTKCGIIKWVSDKVVEVAEDEAATAEVDPAAERAARRAARKAAREAKQAAGE